MVSSSNYVISIVLPLTSFSHLEAAGIMLRLIFLVLFYHCYGCLSFLREARLFLLCCNCAYAISVQESVGRRMKEIFNLKFSWTT